MPDNNGHGNGSFIHGTPLDEPVDLAAVQADDELINALAAGFGVPQRRPGVPRRRPGRRAAVVLARRRGGRADPRAGRPRDGRRGGQGGHAVRPAASARRGLRHLVPVVAAAAAFLVLVGGGVTIGSATAEPDSALWPVSKVLFSERAESVEAAARASDKIDNAKQALTEGKPEQASADLAQAQQDLAKVRPQEGKDELVGVKDFLIGEGGRDAVGHEGRPGVAAQGRPWASDPRGRGAVAAAHHGGHPHARPDHGRGRTTPRPRCRPRGPPHSRPPTRRTAPRHHGRARRARAEHGRGRGRHHQRTRHGHARGQAGHHQPRRPPTAGWVPPAGLARWWRFERGIGAAYDELTRAAQESESTASA